MQQRKWSRAVTGNNALLWTVGVLTLATVYFASAKLGLSLAFMAEQVSAVWPPTGIALAAVLVFGYRVWPGIAIGAFFANATANEPIATAVGIAIGNTLEAMAGAWLLHRVVGFDNTLERVKDAIGLILIAAGLSTLISATIGVTSLYLGGVYLPALGRTIAWSDLGSLWWVWWLGDAMGALVVAPMLLTWSARRSHLPLRRPVEALALFGGLAIASWLVFFGDFATSLGGSSLAYIVFPFVIWAALRFGPPATTAVTLVASGVTIWATLQSLGPFGAGPIHERLLMLQAFMGVVAVTALLLGAALAERRRAEADVRKSEEELRFAVDALRDADRRKDEFLATLAHELRNPLAPIRAGVDIMRLIDFGDAEVRDVLDMLDRQARQITRLVDDLLDVSRVTRGKVRLQIQPVDLKTVVSQAIETSRPLFDARGQELTISLPPEPLPLQADPTRMAQVFANLLNNAAKYSEPGAHTTFSAIREGREVVVRIRDTGHGIDREVLPRIFDLFVQEDRSLARAEGGLGIGLTLVHRLVAMQGGNVQAFSEGLGKGSEFVVRLPLAAEVQIVQTGPPTEQSDGRRVGNAHQIEAQAGGRCPPYDGNTSRPVHRILVVDDNLDAARCLALLLKTDGREVRMAHTGPAALEAAVTFQPDVVLLDIGLPEMDGYEVARRIRERPEGGDVVLIAVTGWGQPADRQRAIEAGFNHHLTKPVDHALLTQLLESLSAGAQAARHTA